MLRGKIQLSPDIRDLINFYRRNPSPDIWKLKGNRIKDNLGTHHTIEKDETLLITVTFWNMQIFH